MKPMTNTVNRPLLSFRLNLTSFLLFLLIFVIEVFIAMFVHDSFIRPYGGDVLVAILIYYFGKTFIETRPLYLCIAVLLFAYSIEIGQYYNLVKLLHLQHNPVMRTIIGSSFSWGDMLAYTLGIVMCYLFERKRFKVISDD